MNKLFSYRVLAGFYIFMLTVVSARANTPEQIFVQASPSVVVIDILDGNGQSIGLGSGVVISAKQVITNCHVAQKGKSLQVRQTDKIFNATLLYADSDRDLCQLNVPNLEATPIVLGTAKSLKVGQRVYAIGTPKGLELTLSEGLISSLRQYEGSQYIQTSAAISPGSSGGGLFDDHGRLVGVTTFQLVEGQNLNFALPVDWIAELPKRAQASRAQENNGSLDWTSRAIALEGKKDWNGLLKLCQKWLKSAPESAIARYNLGIAYERLYQPDEAIKSYLYALKIEPKNAEIWGQLGSAYNNLKQYGLSIKAYEEALSIDPENVELWKGLAFVYSLDGKLDKSIQAMLEATRIEPGNSEYWKTLGFYYTGKARLDKATQAYQEALRIQPGDASAWLAIAGVYDYLQEFDKSVAAYKEVIRIKPEEASAWWGLANALKNHKEYEQAVKAYQEAVRIKPKLAGAWRDLGSTYHSLGQREKVIDVYQTLRTLNPEMAEQYFKSFVLP